MNFEDFSSPTQEELEIIKNIELLIRSWYINQKITVFYPNHFEEILQIDIIKIVKALVKFVNIGYLRDNIYIQCKNKHKIWSGNCKNVPNNINKKCLLCSEDPEIYLEFHITPRGIERLI